MCCRQGAVLFTIYLLLRTACSGAVGSHEPHPETLLPVAVGLPVLLPCLLPHPPPSPSQLRVYWQIAQTDLVVHFFNKGKEEFTHQSPSYINRTRLFSSQLQAGNFSLELRNVSERDNNTTFQCVVSDNKGTHWPSNVTILVKMREDDDGDQSATPPDDGEQAAAPLQTAACEKQLWVTEGDGVVLPCLLPRPFLPLNEMTGYWLTKDTHQEEEKKENGVIFSSGEEKLVEEREQLVHFFDKGKEEFTHQSPSYINRTRLFSSQLQAGNFSLELRNVSERDNNTTFQCVVSDNKGTHRPSNVTILVKMRGDDDVDPSAAPLANSWKWYIGIAVFGLLVLLVIGAVIVVYKKRNPALPNPNTGLCCVRMLV